MPLKKSNNKHLSDEKGRDLRKAIKDRDVDTISWILLEISIKELMESEEITLGKSFISSMLNQLRSQKKVEDSKNKDLPDLTDIKEVEEWIAAL